jgi:hypothetical protein
MAVILRVGLNEKSRPFVSFLQDGARRIGLTPSGITVKVRTCKEGKRFGFESHWP